MTRDFTPTRNARGFRRDRGRVAITDGLPRHVAGWIPGTSYRGNHGRNTNRPLLRRSPRPRRGSPRRVAHEQELRVLLLLPAVRRERDHEVDRRQPDRAVPAVRPRRDPRIFVGLRDQRPVPAPHASRVLRVAREVTVVARRAPGPRRTPAAWAAPCRAGRDRGRDAARPRRPRPDGAPRAA